MMPFHLGVNAEFVLEFLDGSLTPSFVVTNKDDFSRVGFKESSSDIETKAE